MGTGMQPTTTSNELWKTIKINYKCIHEQINNRRRKKKPQKNVENCIIKIEKLNKKYKWKKGKKHQKAPLSSEKIVSTTKTMHQKWKWLTLSIEWGEETETIQQTISKQW